MKFDIPENYHIRWQAALAVLEDLQEDERALFDMHKYGHVANWENPTCGSSACFAGWIMTSTYCKALGAPRFGPDVANWLSEGEKQFGPLWKKIFSPLLEKSSRTKTLAFLKKQLKVIFKESTGKTLTAPLTFYVD